MTKRRGTLSKLVQDELEQHFKDFDDKVLECLPKHFEGLKDLPVELRTSNALDEGMVLITSKSGGILGYIQLEQGFVRVFAPEERNSLRLGTDIKLK